MYLRFYPRDAMLARVLATALFCKATFGSFIKLAFVFVSHKIGGSVAEWLACWTQAQKGPGSNRSRDAVG